MKKRLLRWAGGPLAVLCFFGASNAAHLTFDLNDFSLSGSISKRKVEMFPDSRSFPRTQGTETITADYLSFITDTNGIYVRSNVVAGIYRIVVHGPNQQSTWYINVPVTTNMIQVSDIFGIADGPLFYDNGLGGGGLLLP